MKKTTLTANELLEFQNLENWCVEIIKYFDNLNPIDRSNSLFDHWPKMSFNRSWLKGLRMAYNDTLEMVQDLTSVQYKELDQILKKKFKKGLFDADKKHIKRINKIVEKGKINSEEQYYLLREYFERIWDMPEHKLISEKINRMIDVFESKVKV